MSTIFKFSEITLSDIAQVGGKNASLGEMTTHLSSLGITVPAGFATSAQAYYDFLATNDIDKAITERLNDLNTTNLTDLQQASHEIQTMILTASFASDFESQLKTAYSQLGLKPEQTVAVRSSATAEDLPDASFAGQHETFLNISGIENILTAIKKVYASLFTERAIAYRAHHNLNHLKIAMSAGIQQMVRSDKGASGVIFTLDTESGFDQVILITAAYGLGEALVQGAVNPDEFCVHKPTLKQNKDSIIYRKLGTKTVKMIYQTNHTAIDRTETIAVPTEEQLQFCLNDQEILALARQALTIEKHYGKAVDIEWAKDGVDHQIYIVQARPETVKSNKKHQVLEQYQLKETGKVITSGRSVGQRIGQGHARLLTDPNDMEQLKNGDILVTDMTNPDWEPIMKKASAIITNRGGRTCHAAIIARELGIPAIVGCGNATSSIKEGQTITVSCAEGETGHVYEGLLKFEVAKSEITQLPKLPLKLCMNLANPEQAFTYQFLPNDGVGLARLEFIIGNMIGVHPNALLHFDELTPELQTQIQKKTAGYASPTEFYIEKLTEGIATIAAAFYPKPIIVRFSDFKSNEYANLLGGHDFEPHEENPMLGYRGGSRYNMGNFRECFLLECEAIKRVRDKLGLTNAHIMFPFVRTVNEAKQLIEIIKSQGLERGKNDLCVYMMCEIPSNAILAEDFLQYFDGFSIGSNDLTQLTLGLDRDSAVIANLFDENDPAVKALLHKVITTCKKLNKYVGICGQGPSDHIEFAEWLMDEGIMSISLTPDSIVKTWLTLAKVAK